MDSNLRLIMKSATWQSSGLIVMTVIGFLYTGSFSAGGGIALTSVLVGSVSFFLHEKIWARITWGRRA